MGSLQKYDVYTARFPFLDSAKGKIRPVIVISEPQGKHEVVAVVPISSRVNFESVDVAISDLEAAGLVKSSIAQLHRLGALLQSDLIAHLGSLCASDTEKLQTSMRKYLGL